MHTLNTQHSIQYIHDQNKKAKWRSSRSQMGCESEEEEHSILRPINVV